MSNKKRVLMVAAENDALPGAKVGGVGDVLRDLPKALIKGGALVDTVIPSYGFLARLPGLEKLASLKVRFAGKSTDVQFMRSTSDEASPHHYIIHHRLFYEKGESVYYDDTSGGPFASDATKYAFFCTCVASAVSAGIIPRPSTFHCHDWHTAFLIILLKYDRRYARLSSIRTVFTIHNIAMQGIRPLAGEESSFSQWFPSLRYSLDKIIDPRYVDCINPMRAGIVLADRVHTVSPSYAKEVLLPSDHERGRYGGDGLEHDLKRRDDRGELSGILNGCEYPTRVDKKALPKSKISQLMLDSIQQWAGRERYLRVAHWVAQRNVSRWHAQKAKGMTIVSVGRLTEQKVRILHTTLENGKTALQALLDSLGSNGSYIVLGSGDEGLENFMSELSAKNPNLIFLNGYSDPLSKALYNFGDLFLMPSSFEPCGISQMLAMRAGQPCLVNAVGGLKDTVTHLETGFVFHGETVQEQAKAMLTQFSQCINMFENEPSTFKTIAKNAAKCRFTWLQSADHFLQELY